MSNRPPSRFQSAKQELLVHIQELVYSHTKSESVAQNVKDDADDISENVKMRIDKSQM